MPKSVIACVVAAFVVLGVANSRGDASQAPGKAGNVQLALRLVRQPLTDPGQLMLELTATNTGQSPVVIDRDGAFFHPDLKADQQRVFGREVNKLVKPTHEEARRRLTPLRPGETVTTKLDFSKPIRELRAGHTIMVDRSEVPFLYEANMSYPIPQTAKSVSISMEYFRDGIGDWMAPILFGDWFGDAAGRGPSPGLWVGPATSNVVVVSRGR